MSNPSSTARVAEDTGMEERILEAALHVFSRKGKDGARMREIAEVAGINKALLHYYFRSKDRLYDSVFEHVISKLVRSFGSTLQDAPDFEIMLRTFVGNYVDFVGHNLPVMRLMITEHLSGGRRVAERIKTMMESTTAPLRLFVDRMAEAIARGEIRPVDPHQTLVTVISACVFFFLVFPTVEALVPLATSDREAFIEQRKNHIVDLISRSLRPEGAANRPSSPEATGNNR